MLEPELAFADLDDDMACATAYLSSTSYVSLSLYMSLSTSSRFILIVIYLFDVLIGEIRS